MADPITATTRRLALADFLADLANQIRNGCSDGGCTIKQMNGTKPGGQHTNGGCRCGKRWAVDDLLRCAEIAEEILP